MAEAICESTNCVRENDTYAEYVGQGLDGSGLVRRARRERGDLVGSLGDEGGNLADDVLHRGDVRLGRAHRSWIQDMFNHDLDNEGAILTELCSDGGNSLGELVEDLDGGLRLTLGGDGVAGDTEREERESSEDHNENAQDDADNCVGA